MSASGHRTLAVVMFTDVVGYSSLVQRNETLAIELLEKHRRIIRPLFVKNNGREIKTIGDAFLVEFSSAFEALQCALQIQHSLNEFNSSRPSEPKIRLRIGIHLGDIIRNDSDILGDAVNIASRIEPLAEPGGICISEQVYDQVRNKFQSPMIRLEDIQLKNIDTPIGVYRIVMSEGDFTVTTAVLPSTRIAILPFVNISPDPHDEYFSHGLTEELIAKVSRISGLKVIARTSIMNYKGKEKSVTQIGKELNAGSIVEGSVRKSGNKIRVTVQLVDANNEEHLWAENYDKNLDDIFEIQSEISAKVAESLVSNLLRPKSLVEPAEKENVATYSLYLRANQLRHLDQEKPVREALKLLDAVVVESPNFARA
jgi:adenylate cyclase